MRFKSALSLLLAGSGVLTSTNPLYAQRPETPVPEGYVGRTTPKEGLAPKVKVTEFAKTGRQFEVVFSKGDEVISGLTDLAAKYHLGTSHFTAIGAVDKATLGWSDPVTHFYKKNEINQEVEIIAFTGNIVTTNGKPYVHAHMVVGLPDGTTRGGHVIDATISLTMQLFLEELEPLNAGASAKSDQ
jgi:uncharacterized protein